MRVIFDVFSDAGKAEDLQYKLQSQGLRPEVHKKIVRAEDMGYPVYVVVADWPEMESKQT